MVQRWLLYLDGQDNTPLDLQRKILVVRLRNHDKPPGRWLRETQRLPALMPVEEFMLEESYHQRWWGSREWAEDILDFVGEAGAKQWLEARRRQERG